MKTSARRGPSTGKKRGRNQPTEWRRQAQGKYEANPKDAQGSQRSLTHPRSLLTGPVTSLTTGLNSVQPLSRDCGGSYVPRSTNHAPPLSPRDHTLPAHAQAPRAGSAGGRGDGRLVRRASYRSLSLGGERCIHGRRNYTHRNRVSGSSKKRERGIQREKEKDGGGG